MTKFSSVFLNFIPKRGKIKGLRNTRKQAQLDVNDVRLINFNGGDGRRNTARRLNAPCAPPYMHPRNWHVCMPITVIQLYALSTRTVSRKVRRSSPVQMLMVLP